MTATSFADAEQAHAGEGPHMQSLPQAGTIGAGLGAGRRRWADISPTSSWGNSMSIRDFFRLGAAEAAAERQEAEQEKLDVNFQAGRASSCYQETDEGMVSEQGSSRESLSLMGDLFDGTLAPCVPFS